MQGIVSDLVVAFGLFWVALILFGLVAGFMRGQSRPDAWWDLSDDERDQQVAIEQARRDYVDDLRPPKPQPPTLRTVDVHGQPVRDSLLKLAGKAQTRRRDFVPRDAA